MLKVENLTKTFKKINAVENVIFRSQRWRNIGLLGENGAGKTTTLRMVATMLKPTSGNAILIIIILLIILVKLENISVFYLVVMLLYMIVYQDEKI